MTRSSLFSEWSRRLWHALATERGHRERSLIRVLAYLLSRYPGAREHARPADARIAYVRAPLVPQREQARRPEIKGLLSRMAGSAPDQPPERSEPAVKALMEHGATMLVWALIGAVALAAIAAAIYCLWLCAADVR